MLISCNTAKDFRPLGLWSDHPDEAHIRQFEKAWRKGWKRKVSHDFERNCATACEISWQDTELISKVRRDPLRKRISSHMILVVSVSRLWCLHWRVLLSYEETSYCRILLLKPRKGARCPRLFSTVINLRNLRVDHIGISPTSKSPIKCQVRRKYDTVACARSWSRQIINLFACTPNLHPPFLTSSSIEYSLSISPKPSHHLSPSACPHSTNLSLAPHSSHTHEQSGDKLHTATRRYSASIPHASLSSAPLHVSLWVSNDDTSMESSSARRFHRPRYEC